MVVGSNPVAVTSPSDFAPASSKEFLDIQATIECGFTLKRVRDMIKTCSHIISNFNYCPLVWMFSTAKSLNKTESLQKRALRFLYNDYSISYEGLLEKAGKVKMNIYRLRNLCIEIYKTINKLNPEFMNNIFKVKENKRVVREQCKLNLETTDWNQVTFGAKSLEVYGSKVWNSLPSHIKTSENLIQFKSLMKNWNGNSCSCTVCTK